LAINIAVDGDTIDMSGLACSKITLERGEIAIDKDNLTLKGPSDHALAIDAAYGSRVINHSGGGILLARYLDFTHGASAKGGCILSNGGAVALEHSTVSACSEQRRRWWDLRVQCHDQVQHNYRKYGISGGWWNRRIFRGAQA
jgi:hypothetical protein